MLKQMSRRFKISKPSSLAYLALLMLNIAACRSEPVSLATPTPAVTPTATATPTPAAQPSHTLTAVLTATPTALPSPTAGKPGNASGDDLETTPPATSTPQAEAQFGSATPAVQAQTDPVSPTATSQPDLEIPAAESPSGVASPTATLSPDTSDPLFIESLRQHRDDPPPTIEIISTLAETDRFIRYQMAYTSDGVKITGVMNVPKADAPDAAPRFPVILLNHGYYNPDTYTPGTGTQAEADYLAAHGYVTIASDYRGYAGSEGDFGGHFDPGWTYDILDLLDALPSLDVVDPERVGMWGHSTGGEIALRVITARDSVDATVLFGSMGADAADNFRLVQGWGGGHEIIQRYGTPEEAPEVWAKLSPITYLANVAGPISIHHGELDGEVPPELSARLWQAMQAAGAPGEYYTYPDQRHIFRGEAWTLAMERTLAFFDKYVKNQAP
ncbi:MAG: hypothetical protein DPW09_08625 [Anaerolineae bacterium]|nr:hypothetical protein [Anaerolineae bacterium]